MPLSFLKKQARHPNRNGFTIIEALLAVTLIMFAALGPLNLVNRGLKEANALRQQTVAAYLGLEGMEAIRTMRDSEAFTNPFHDPSDDWLGPLRSCVGTNCYINVMTGGAPTVTTCVGSCPALRQSAAGYDYNGANPVSPFTRSVTLTEAAAVPRQHATATVSVMWNDGVFARSISYEYHIFNIQP